MLFTHTTYIGIDPTAGQKPITYAALDGSLHLLALGQGSLEDVAAFCAGQQSAFIAVCAPRRPNQGRMAQEEVRRQLSPSPSPGRWKNFRICEFLLRQHNIHIPRTPGRDEDAPNWMRLGWQLFLKLDRMGYQPYPFEDGSRQSLEVYPHASFTALLGLTPFPKNSLEGRLQRQLVLSEMDMHVADPMRFFEEITRHKILKGTLPFEQLYSAAELDALVGAYTAWVASNRPLEAGRVGDALEGEIILPVADLKQRYS